MSVITEALESISLRSWGESLRDRRSSELGERIRKCVRSDCEYLYRAVASYLDLSSFSPFARELAVLYALAVCVGKPHCICELNDLCIEMKSVAPKAMGISYSKTLCLMAAEVVAHLAEEFLDYGHVGYDKRDLAKAFVSWCRDVNCWEWVEEVTRLVYRFSLLARVPPLVLAARARITPTVRWGIEILRSAVEIASRVLASSRGIGEIESVDGYEYTYEPHKALPQELALDELFLMGLFNGFKTYRYERRTPILYVLVDFSGSMEMGNRLGLAIGSALAAVAIVGSRGRVFARVYNSTTYPYPGDPPAEGVEEILHLLGWAKPGYQTKTSLALETAASDIERMSLCGATVLLVTDGEDAIENAEGLASRFRAMDARVNAVVAGGVNPSIARLVSLTGGRYFRAEGIEDGVRIVEEVIGEF